MPWGRLDDQANGNAKLLALSDPAWRMWGCGLIYCQFNLTDGFIADHAIETFGVRAKNKRAVADELCRVLVPGKGPLWHQVDGGYQVHDFLDWNDSKEKVESGRQATKQRVERFRKRMSNGVTHSSKTPTEQTSTPTSTGRSVKEPERPDRAREATVMTGSLHRDHLTCFGPCLRICYPMRLANEHIKAIGGDENQALERLAAFRRDVLASIKPDQPIGDSPFDFWRAHFAATFPSAAPSARKPIALAVGSGRTGSTNAAAYNVGKGRDDDRN